MLFFIVLITAGIALAAAPNGTVSCYKMDQTSGSVVDSIDSNPGTTSGSVTRGLTGQVDNAFSFEGGASVDIGSNSNLDIGSNGFTVASWINTSSTSSRSPLITDNGTALGFYPIFVGDNSGALAFLGGNNFKYFGNAGLFDGDWHHIAFTITGLGINDIDNAKFYIDGVSQGVVSTIKTVAPAITRTDLIATGTLGSYTGHIDELIIINRTLNLTEINELFDAGVNGTSVCQLAEQEIPEVGSNKTLQIFTILIAALLIGAFFLRKQ